MINIEKPILIDIPMPIETPRLILRPIMPGDGAAIQEAKVETFDQLHQWMPWAKELGTAEDMEATARENHAKFIRREDIMIVGFEKSTGRYVIGTGLHRFNWAVRRFEIGYWVRASAQGNGYATEAANALTRYAFAQLQARSVMINFAEGNENSRRVIEKLGFEKEGTVRQVECMPDGTVTDMHLYSVLAPDKLPPLDVKWEGGP